VSQDGYIRRSYGSDSFLRLSALAAADMQAQYNGLQKVLAPLLTQVEASREDLATSVELWHQMLRGSGMPPCPASAAMVGVPMLDISAEEEVEDDEDEDEDED